MSHLPPPSQADLVRYVAAAGLLKAACSGRCRALGAGHDLRNFDIDNNYGREALQRVLEDICGESLPLEGVKARNFPIF